MKKRFLLFLAVLMGLTSAMATDEITCSDFSIGRGETKTFGIKLSNEGTNYVGFQMDLTLPEGLTINKASCSLSDRITDEDQELTIGKQSENTYRLTSASLSLTPISGTSGDLITISVTASNTYQSGNTTISNILFATSNSNRVTMNDVTFGIYFGVISFVDANVKALCVANWDTNGDGELDYAEAAAVTDLGDVFYRSAITSFDELQHFTGLTSIGDNAFHSCSGLTTITIPNCVTSIGIRSFVGCTGLTSITIPNSVTNIGDIAFASCSGLTSITISENVTSIGESTFSYCSDLTSITIPNSMTSIGEHAFEGCTGLTSITIPNSVTSIGSGAFSYCSGLTSIVVDSDNTIYDSRDNCNAIILTASNNLIAGCKNTFIPNSLTSICDKAFEGCSGLTSITITSGVTNIGSWAFSDCDGLTSITIPNSVTSISDYTFSGCSNLISITIPNSVTSIGTGAFQTCFCLVSITIPNSVTSIGNDAFWGCTDLTIVTSENEIPISITSYVFSNRTNATLYVPWGCKSAYEAADYWNEFKEIVEYGNSEITIGAIGISTYSSSIDLDFTDVDGLKAYIASGYSPSTGELTMTRVYKVPAGEGLLLKGTAGNYDVPYAEVDNIYANMLVGVPTATTVSPTEGSYTNLILANGVNGIGFYTLSKTGEIAAGKAYLQIPTSALPAAGARSINLLFEDEEDNETTGVNDIRNKMEDNRSSIYSLSGQRVGKPAKGLYIKNGKKIMVN